MEVPGGGAGPGCFGPQKSSSRFGRWDFFKFFLFKRPSYQPQKSSSRFGRPLFRRPRIRRCPCCRPTRRATYSRRVQSSCACAYYQLPSVSPNPCIHLSLTRKRKEGTTQGNTRAKVGMDPSPASTSKLDFCFSCPERKSRTGRFFFHLLALQH